MGGVFTQGACGNQNKLGTSSYFLPCLSSPYTASFQESPFASHLAVSTRIADGPCLTFLWFWAFRVRSSHSHTVPQPVFSLAF